ncbi:CC2D2AN-C2 domain-containing protein [Haematococcus lacustris]|uniref:CC2D2AN-C2 domain-containing protein n=1 Tax=Haematococcus lacustris TaxID=44745 RepID=A0A699ZKE3_HAELA|nr:CC2D2AN-C2 domain-containing protein [Haematococcus lacustris]
MAVDTEGTSLLITRYIAATPLPPTLSVLAGVPPATPLPVAVSNTELFMLKVARTVALLPYLEDSALQKRRVDVWSSSAEAVALAAGDAEEHAHLLAGWFLEVGQQALVVLGASTVGGKSAFVLTTGQAAYADPRNPTAGAATYDWDVRQLRLWNPLMGSCVSVLDCTGDMREVGCVYDHSNIWANVQIPPRVMGTIQNVPAYGELPDRFYEQLEARVEEAVRDCLQKARALGAFLTKPDNKVSRLLRALLKDMPGAMESIAAANLASSLALAAQAEGAAPAAADTGLGDRHRVIKGLQDMHNEVVMKESRADWVCGHILALPFSDRYADAVTEAVLNTGIHRIADERVKYSMAAHVERSGIAFCSCLWIYVAALR